MNFRSIRLSLGAFALVFLLWGVSHYLALPLGDPDRFYHFALSRILAEHGKLWLPSLPQVEDLGWGEYFPDKEFLAHALGSIAYRLHGEAGVSSLFLLAAAGTALGLFAYAATLLSPGLAFLVVLPWFFNAGFVFRLLFLRPYVFAVCAFTLMNVALLRRRSALVVLAGMVYALSYHALYLPLAALVLFAASAAFEPAPSRKAYWKLALWGVVGLAMGAALNPYFPANLVAMWQQLYGNYLAQTSLRSVRFGAEIYALSAPLFFKLYALPLTALGAAFVLFGRGGAKGAELRYLTVLSVFFLYVTFQSARGGEYLVPSLALLAATVAGHFAGSPRLAPILGVLCILQAGLLWNEWRAEGATNPEAGLDRENAEALALPLGGSKVFNCDWALGAFLLHQRPDLRFVDVLDPLSLYFHDKSRFLQHEALRNGRVGDAVRVLQSTFHADYVLCREGELAAQLRSDPRTQLLYPAPGQNSALSLFYLNGSTEDVFVHDWEARFAGPASSARDYDPANAPRKTLLPMHLDTAYFDLNESAGETCQHLSPTKNEMATHAGAAYLGLGGGPAMRAWRNGRPLFASGHGFPRPRSVQALIALDPPLKANDHFDFLYCGPGGGSFFGAQISFWKKAQLAELCAQRRGKEPVAAQSGWLTTDQETCIAPLAHPGPDPELRL